MTWVDHEAVISPNVGNGAAGDLKYTGGVEVNFNSDIVKVE